MFWHLIPWLKCCQIYIDLIGFIWVHNINRTVPEQHRTFQPFFRPKNLFSDVDLTFKISFEGAFAFVGFDTPNVFLFFFNISFLQINSVCQDCWIPLLVTQVSKLWRLTIGCLSFRMFSSLCHWSLGCFVAWNRRFSRKLTLHPPASTNHPMVLRTSRIWIWTMAIWVATSPGLSRKIRNRQQLTARGKIGQKRWRCGEFKRGDVKICWMV